MDLNTPPIDVSKLSDYDKRELSTFIQNEAQKAKIQESVHDLTSLCWQKCIKGPIKSSGLERGELSCTQNCVERYLDTNLALIKHLDQMRAPGGGIGG